MSTGTSTWQIARLDETGTRHLVDGTTEGVTSSFYRLGTSTQPGKAAAQAEGRKAREHKSKVDGMVTKRIPAAVELSGRWGEGMVSLFKKGVKLVPQLRWKSCGALEASSEHRGSKIRNATSTLCVTETLEK